MSGERDITLTAGDGRALAATLHLPASATLPPVLIGSATAVKRGYYTKFARYLADRGHTVLAFDYRGVGGSAEPNIRRDPARMLEWGTLDLDAALAALANEAEGAPLYVGHSVGGQILPLAERAHDVRALLLVASQSGAARHWTGLDRLKLASFWGAMPWILALHGHLPGWVMGSEPLPRGVAEEWARWGRHPDYILGHVPGLEARFKDIARPMLAFSFADDFYCPRPAAEALLGWYGGTGKAHRHVRASEVGAPSIGHFGFFRDRFRDTLWREAADWLGSHRPGVPLTEAAGDSTLAQR
ncbi:MAG TPA: alpha/beta fold hydrolase [Azospirillaceae bacterium]|nr:alpha/beta fold hydrolase [Azospirillaceae bacterium]